MPPGGRSLPATRLALAWLLAAACMVAAAQPVQAPGIVIVAPGQSATEIALDQVPAGTTIDQFLLALYRSNPQAFVADDLNRLLNQARLRLPSADEANRVPLDQAREQLRQIREGQPHVAASPPRPAAAPRSAERDGSVSEPGVTQAAPDASAPERAAPPPATAATPSFPAARSGHLLLIAGSALALLAALLWHVRRTRKPGPDTRAESTKTQALTDDLQDQAQGRFKPVLPDSPVGARPSGRFPRDTETPPTANDRPEGRAPTESFHRPGGQAPTGVGKPALFDLDLSLDGPAPPLDLGLAKAKAAPQDAAPKASAPSLLDLSSLCLDLSASPNQAKAPGPLDLGGMSLDLNALPVKRTPGPLDLSGISLDLDAPDSPSPTKGPP